jgi:Tol biopolymer transport system component
LRLGDGSANALSPDQKWAMVQTPAAPQQLKLLPTGPGESQIITNDSINHQYAKWVPDGKRFIFTGNEPGKGVRLYIQDLGAGKPTPISPEGVDAQSFAVSADGQWVAGVDHDHKTYLYPTNGGAPHLMNGTEPEDVPISFSQDGHSLFVFRKGEVPAKVYRVELVSGNKTVLKEIAPIDPTGVSMIGPILITPDGKNYVYGFYRTLGDLYLVEGLK